MKKSIVILYTDICDKWIDILKDGEFNTLGLHFITSRSKMEDYLEWLDNGGRAMIEKIEAEGILVEHELHALTYLLPRELFKTHPEYFRENDKGERTENLNLCIQSKEALNIVEERAFELAKMLNQTGHRYYLWSDDSKNAWCRCPACKNISDSDQYLTLLESILRGIKRYDKSAELCYLAYLGTLEPPTKPIPDGIFLEFAPICRNMFTPITSEENEEHRKNIEKLLAVFPAAKAEILEYWLDVSLYTKWGRLPLERVPFDATLLKTDFAYYKSLGVSAIKTFGAYMSEKYMELFGTKEITDFGKLLR